MSEAIIIIGLGYGDEGKGRVVDQLVRDTGARTVVRFNGGAQAAHNVVTPDGRHHTFAQFGSGSLAGAATHLGPDFLVNPLNLFAEAEHLQELGVERPLGLVSVDPQALVTTPFQVAANQLRERARAGGRHGSCGLGIGETVQDSVDGYGVRVADFGDPRALESKLRELQIRKRQQSEQWIWQVPGRDRQVAARALYEDSEVEELVRIYLAFAEAVRVQAELDFDDTVIFEGAQGVLLDQDYGFFPHVTRSRTTAANALGMLAGFDGPIRKIGVTRTYMTRHGAGPFVSESPELARALPEPHNGWGPWQESWRVGHLDLVSLRYAAAVAGGVDELAVTCLDRTADLELALCSEYRLEGESFQIDLPQRVDLEAQALLTEKLFCCLPVLEPCYDVVEEIEKVVKAPVTLTTAGMSELPVPTPA